MMMMMMSMNRRLLTSKSATTLLARSLWTTPIKYQQQSKTFVPPIQLFGLEGTYATALFKAAYMDSTIDSTASSLNSIQNLIHKDSSLKSILENPALSPDDRVSIVNSLLKGINGKSNKDVDNFLKVLADNNRLNLLSVICEQYNKLNDAQQGIVQGNIISSKQLDDKVMKRLHNGILQSKSIVKEGQVLKLNNLVRPDILGGLIVEIDDKTVDLSLSTKIQNLNKILNETI
ncbi:F1F0 ATP synthase subunit 5 NDAI_0C04090 [Naumovozyma dairenensis CBS 421]|uniref:ATP synthase subunit 5, mitochondrial n=1 Tax=Naumovozyma dairenensis (strain ATCC 10597 / BCRC 20456 / CBS 421 / NBRC 0211 / NRRL Y-12639) TaxID=1071378 RepID=G0W8F8_NAUDC|nr:hypothetical protein NDAI_0C04090 [Naumovozyma dairenensis CBS 421]CCD24069.1 hypothetical protein NDAI_0C04090 [Naumovozyma dairenensis CBS 421]